MTIDWKPDPQSRLMPKAGRSWGISHFKRTCRGIKAPSDDENCNQTGNSIKTGNNIKTGNLIFAMSRNQIDNVITVVICLEKVIKN